MRRGECAARAMVWGTKSVLRDYEAEYEGEDQLD